jgi:hypothetical protein
MRSSPPHCSYHEVDRGEVGVSRSWRDGFNGLAKVLKDGTYDLRGARGLDRGGSPRPLELLPGIGLVCMPEYWRMSAAA